YSALLMTEPLAALGVMTATWLFARDQRPVHRALAAGAVLGLTTLVRPQSLLCAPALLLLVRPRDGAWKDRALAAIKPTALALAAALGVVAPWTARNCRVMDGCALVSTN